MFYLKIICEHYLSLPLSYKQGEKFSHKVREFLPSRLSFFLYLITLVLLFIFVLLSLFSLSPLLHVWERKKNVVNSPLQHALSLFFVPLCLSILPPSRHISLHPFSLFFHHLFSTSSSSFAQWRDRPFHLFLSIILSLVHVMEKFSISALFFLSTTSLALAPPPLFLY